MSQTVLMKEFKALAREKWVEIDVDEDNIYHWNLALMVINPDSMYYGGFFKAQMTFPKDYPYKPPDFRFTKPLWHPNIYPDGRLCISILHAPGEDMMSGETAGERWSPAQRVESVLLSILSLLDDAEVSSPANVDASVMYRDDRPAFEARVKRDVDASRKDIPDGFIMVWFCILIPTRRYTLIVSSQPMSRPSQRLKSQSTTIFGTIVKLKISILTTSMISMTMLPMEASLTKN